MMAMTRLGFEAKAWIDSPTFSVRPEVHDWLAEEPPADAGE